MCLIGEARQRSIDMVFWFTPQPQCVSVSGGCDCLVAVHTVTGTDEVAVHCVIVFSACVCMSARHYLQMENLYQFCSPSHRSGSVPPSIAGVGDIYIENECLSERQNGRQRKREHVVCSELFSCRVWEMLDVIKLFVLNCPVNEMLSFFQNRIHHLPLFLSALTDNRTRL